MYRIARGAAALLLALGLSVPGSASAVDFVYAVVQADATRWMDKDSAQIGTVSVGQKMEVLHEEGDRIRVRLQGASFGWLDRSVVATEDPGAAPAAPVEDDASETDDGE